MYKRLLLMNLKSKFGKIIPGEEASQASSASSYLPISQNGCDASIPTICLINPITSNISSHAAPDHLDTSAKTPVGSCTLFTAPRSVALDSSTAFLLAPLNS